MSNLKITTTNFDVEQLDQVFGNLKECSSNLLYTNCIGKIKIGDDYYLSKQFDTCFYSYENDVLILIEKCLNKTNSAVRKYLSQKNILFDEVSFINSYDEHEYNYDCTIPKIAFAREKEILAAQISDSKTKGFNNCTFYPKVESELVIDSSMMKLDQRSSQGLIVLPDKYIFVVNDMDPRNMSMATAASVLLNLDMNVVISQERFPQELLKDEKGSKVLCKKI